MALGTYNSGCSGCKPASTLILGTSFKYADIGLRYQAVEKVPTYGLGFLFNANGRHRFGLHIEDENPEVAASTVMKTGVGYTYVGSEDSINLEATQSKTKTASTSLNFLGYRKKINKIEISMTYEMGEGGAEGFWMGAGFKGQTFHLSVYSQYSTKLLIVLSAFF